MKNLHDLSLELDRIKTVEKLVAALEGIASQHISQTKDFTLASRRYFQQLWSVYTHMRVGSVRARRAAKATANKPQALVLITAEEHLAGALDLKVIAAMLKQYDPQTTDIIVLGSHGAFVLANRRVKLRYFFRMVDPGHTADLRNVMDLILPYKQVKVFFKSYQSLGKQTVAALDLLQTVLPLLEQAKGEGLISPRNYTFEPSAEEIAGFMEDVMIENALGQTVLQSQLAQLANRFILMIAAHQRSKELRQKLQHQFYRSKRQLSDERMRETMLAARLHA